MPEKRYKTPTAFRTALETRLNKMAKENGSDLELMRRQVAFDRFLSRIFKNNSEQVVLKGGYSMALRNPKARATRDIDLAIKVKSSSNHNDDDRLLDFLRECTSIDLGDFFEFRAGLSTLDLQAVPYGGKRFPIEAMMDRRLFVRFPIDIIVTSLILDPIEHLVTKDWLRFAGIESISYPTISKEQQFAEKLHAYTFPREENENSRVKDVVDMFLLLEFDNLDQVFLKKAIKEVFEYRGTHEVPNYLMEHPENWGSRFDRLRSECGIKENLDQCFFFIANFLKLPTIVYEEKQATVPNQTRCHFCGANAQVWMPKLPIGSGAINEIDEMFDCDCKNCGPIRMSGLFAAMNNTDQNSNNWKAWGEFLRKRDKEFSNKRLLITTMNAVLDFEKL